MKIDAKRTVKPRKNSQYISRSKTFPPTISDQEIKRAQILKLLTTHSHIKLWMLLAPAGYGKTTAMCQIMQHFHKKSFISIWLNLDDGDNDMSRFLNSFATAISPHSSILADTLSGFTSNEELAHHIIESLYSISQPTVIYFDNFEILNNPAVCSVIARGIEALPDHCKIVIGSRTLPNIGLSRLTTRDQVYQIDASTLRFSTEETTNFMRHDLTFTLKKAQITHLQQSTEGWPTALKLAHIALKDKKDADSFIAHFSGSNAAIAAFLAEEVLLSMPEDNQAFLMQTSILDELTPSVCNQLLGRTNSLDTLLNLEKRHLFLKASDNNEVFSYHSLFRDFLLTQLQRRCPEQLKALHLSASQIYMGLDRPIPAIRHALKADSNKAVELLENHADNLLSEGRIGLLTQLLDQVPSATLDKNAHLKLIYALCLTYTRGPMVAYQLIKNTNEAELPAEAAAYLLALRPMQLAMMDRIQEAHEQGMQASEKSLSNPNAQVTLSQALTQTSIILGKHDQARQYCDQARSSQSLANDLFNRVLADTAEATMELMRGHLKQASQRLTLSLDELHNTQNSHRGIAMATIQLAEILYEQDRSSEAKQLLMTNSALVQDIGPPDTLITANVILSRILAKEGDYDTALQLLIELEQSGHRLKIPRVLASARLERAQLWLARGDINGANEQLNLSLKTFDWEAISGLWFAANDTLTPDILKLRIQLHKNNVDKTLPQLRNLIKIADREQRSRRALKLRILLAEALFNKGDRNAAQRTLTQALQFAQPEGFIQTFIEEERTIATLLNDTQQQALFDGVENGDNNLSYAQLIASRMNASAATHNPTTGNEEDRLTNKELQVLNVLALGLSNMAMAEKLFVSESTIRTHLRNINLKLNAKNRTEAVNIARQTGLIT